MVIKTTGRYQFSFLFWSIQYSNCTLKHISVTRHLQQCFQWNLSLKPNCLDGCISQTGHDCCMWPGRVCTVLSNKNSRTCHRLFKDNCYKPSQESTWHDMTRGLHCTALHCTVFSRHFQGLKSTILWKQGRKHSQGSDPRKNCQITAQYIILVFHCHRNMKNI